MGGDLTRKERLARALETIKLRQAEYSIIDFNYGQKEGKPFIQQQKELVEEFQKCLMLGPDKRKRYFLYYGGNGAGKTAIGAYITALLALGKGAKQLGLPYLGDRKTTIWIGTKSGANVRNVIEPYLFGEGSICRIPPEFVEKMNYDNGILKYVMLKNGTTIAIYTYDQGQEKWQGWSPDFMWLDEEPTDGDVFMEANARMRKLECQMLVTMTPLSGITRVAEYLVNTEDEGLRNKVMVKRVSSMDNPFTDKSWTLGLTDEERRLRVDGTFENPTGLVYSCFHRDTCVMDSGLIHPHLGCKYYAGVDFGVSHPTAVVFVVEDQYGYMQVYKEWRKSNASLSEIAQVISREDALVHLQYVVRDSASAREGLELDRLWLKTIPADKHSRWASGESNRRAGIMMLNNLFLNGRLYLGKDCPILVRELETHRYKEWEKDGAVIKEGDDMCFVGSTMVATASWDKRIDEIAAWDYVVTPFWLSRVSRAWSKWEREVMAWGPVLCTPEHKVLYDNDWRRVDSVRYVDTMVSELSFANLFKWKLLLSSNSKATSTSCSPRASITSSSQEIGNGLLSCIRTFGSTLTGWRFRKAMKFTTSISTTLITTLATWSLYRASNIARYIPSAIGTILSSCSASMTGALSSVLWLRSGTVAKLERSGTGNTTRKWSTCFTSSMSARASSVESNSYHEIQNDGSAVTRTSTTIGSQAESITSWESANVANESSRSTSIWGSGSVPGPVLREEVFDLTVNAWCFYANGILVSNCDALRYVVTDVYRATTVAKSPNKSRFEKKYGEGLSRWKPLL